MGTQTQTVKLKLADHIKEFQIRLMWCAGVFLSGGFLGYLARKPLIIALRKPLDETLYYTSPAGGFNFVVKVAVITGLVLALPVIIYNLVKFMQPALHNHITNKHVNFITFMSLILALAGGVFAFWWVVPMSLHFFKGFKDGNLTSLIAADTYLSFVINCIISFMVIFQLPLIILFIDRIKPLPPKKLWKFEKYVVVGSLVIALILPFTYDPISQFLVAVPIIVLYNLSILFVLVAHRSKNQLKPVHAKVQQTQRADYNSSKLTQTLQESLATASLSNTSGMPQIIQNFTPRRKDSTQPIKRTSQRARNTDGFIHSRPKNSNEDKESLSPKIPRSQTQSPSYIGPQQEPGLSMDVF